MMKKIIYYVNIFLFYSFLGFLFESVVTNSFFNSGVLRGPWTFIYGIAILIIILVDKFLKQFKLKKGLEIIIFYVMITIILALVEYSAGMLILKIFHVIYWDYTNLTFNYGPFIALEISLLWGLLATFINYIGRVFIDKLVVKIPVYVTIILVIFFGIDVIVTFF